MKKPAKAARKSPGPELIRGMTQLRDSMKSGALREAIKQAANKNSNPSSLPDADKLRMLADLEDARDDARKSQGPELIRGMKELVRHTKNGTLHTLKTSTWCRSCGSLVMVTPHPDTAKVEAVRALCGAAIREYECRGKKAENRAWGLAASLADDILRILSTPAKGKKR